MYGDNHIIEDYSIQSAFIQNEVKCNFQDNYFKWCHILDNL